MVRTVGLSLAGGWIAGALVGLGEAIYILGGASTGEYVALVYAVVLYAILGAGGGFGIGCGLAVLSLIKVKFAEDRAWLLGFLGILCGLGVVITRYVANKAIYLEQGVPLKGLLVILAVYGTIGLLGLWIGRILLTQTPFKILLTTRGTSVAYLGLFVLALVFSYAPDDGSRSGTLIPDREQPPGLSKRPNMLLIMVDTLRADHLGSYGYDGPISPQLDDLASDSVLFQQAFTSASWTRASTASLFTGMVPSSHSCDVKVAQLPDDVTTIAEVLQGQGYVTGGLPNNINVTRSFNFQQGFDWFEYQAPEYIAGATETASQLSMYNVVRKIRDRLTDGKKRVEDYYQPADVVLGNAQEFIEGNKDRRWFSWVHLMEPHDPYFERPFNGKGIGRAEMESPPESLKDEIVEAYVEEITWMDTELGKFFDWMKAEGLYDNTVIVLTSDHGEEFLEHGGWWHGTTLYDEQLHVPLIVKLPGQQWAGVRVPWQVRQMDTAATLAVLAGAPVPMEWQGDDLFEEEFDLAQDVLSGGDVASEDVDSTPDLEEAVDDVEALDAPPPPPTRAELILDRERIVLAEENFEGNVLSGVRTGGWKYIRANEGNRRGVETEELFDLVADPGEQTNMVGKMGAKQVELSQQLRTELEMALRVKVASQDADISLEDCERMRALGYVEGDCAELTGSKSAIVPTGAAPETEEGQ